MLSTSYRPLSCVCVVILVIFCGAARADTPVGGNITADITWAGTILVYSNVVVRSPATLTIEAGTVVRLTNNVGIAANAGGHVIVGGTAAQPVTFSRMASTFTRWGDLAATGSGATLTIRHARIERGRVRASNGGTTLLEDSELSLMTSSGIIGGNGGALFTVRRCYVHDYEDIDLINTRTLAEDSLFERADSDIFELQNSPPGSILRRCTFRTSLNDNSDGVDMNGCRNVLIDSCRIYDVTDKGISSGSALSASDPTSFGLVVTNTLIYNADTAIGIKDQGTASLFNNTIAAVANGIRVYQKFTGEGGYVTNGANNLIWNVAAAILEEDDGTVLTRFSDIQGMNFPGIGNISADPLWRDPVAHDYRLGQRSPCAEAGESGADIGIVYPVGGLPGTPARVRAMPANVTNVLLYWTAAGGASTYIIERAVGAGPFNRIASIPASMTNHVDAGLAPGTYNYRVLATNFIGASFENEIFAVTVFEDDDADGMADTWEDQNGLDTGTNDAAGDLDGDGYSNLQEFLAGTRPNDMDSLLRLSILAEGGQAVLTFQRAAAKSYTLQSRGALANSPWVNGLEIPAEPNDSFFSITNAVGGAARFFRLSVP
jgi:hypothetical protein